jgi:hypothetical protein
MGSALRDVRLDELGSIPSLWMSGQYGPYAGGVSFRVGVVDERLQTRGITSPDLSTKAGDSIRSAELPASLSGLPSKMAKSIKHRDRPMPQA